MNMRILIVDDEKPIVTLLKYNIEKAGITTDVAYDGIEAIKMVKKSNYDLIILDLMLPGMDGMEVCKHLRQNEINTPIIMLTAKDDEVDKIIGLELGADDYITKPFSPREVIARIKAVLRRAKSQINIPNFIRIGDLIIFPERYEVELHDKKLDFTRKEFDLLLFLARHKGIVLLREQLLQEVWEYDFAGDTRIVDVHISRLREKIEPNTKQPRYIKTIHGVGYKLDIEDS